jgi:hypothetical protein
VVDFYNQPLVNIHVTKLEVSGSGTAAGEGWNVTVTGCGVNASKKTDASGAADFTALLSCPSGYTVSEDAASKPGFVQVGPSSTTVFATIAGATYSVGFENAHIVVSCVSGCVPTVQTPTAAPSLPPPSPTTVVPVPVTPVTATTTPRPTATDVVLGAKPPGPAASATPLPPSTGTGAGSGDDSAPALLFAAGVVAVAGGVGAVSTARRKRRRAHRP